ncbi:hypothetical protein L747_06145 [Levilactobacillus brevis BSO 464]|nr:hypothetical protein L747_06145 [Levilactobacillus brevis BSO 464]
MHLHKIFYALVWNDVGYNVPDVATIKVFLLATLVFVDVFEEVPQPTRAPLKITLNPKPKTNHFFVLFILFQSFQFMT